MRTALRRIEPGARTLVVDSYDYAALVVSRIVADGYIQMVKTIPQLYRYIYARAERATRVGHFRTWAHEFTAGNLRPLILRERPDVVVCTHAFPCGAMAAYKRLYADAPPVVGIVTDLAVHGFWIHGNIEGYVVATDAMRDALLARGVSRERVLVSGIPVRPEFSRPPEPRDALRERLDLPRDRQIVLLMGGGLGIAPLERMMRKLEAVRLPLAGVVISGRNAAVERRLSRCAESVSYPVRVLRFVENVYDYMHAADALVTKPGGLSTAEALVAGVPLVLCKPLPGQEERNASILVKAGAAIESRAMDELPAAIERVLTDARKRDALMAAAGHLARPNAAGDAAQMIARLGMPQREVVA